jgi:hypothetical protein
MKELWNDMETAGARIGGEKRQFRDFQPAAAVGSDYDPRQRRRTDDASFALQQVSRGVDAAAESMLQCSNGAGVCSGMTRMGTT